MKKILLFCLILSVSFTTTAQIQYLYLDTICQGDCPGVPSEYTSIQLYAHCTNPTDVISTIFGVQGTPLYITTDCCFYQSELGASTGSNINCAFCGIFPDVCYDSWVGLGCSCSGACNEVFVLQSAGQPWLDSFNETPCANTL
ncbi:MAG: hypothetical protein JNM00_13745, partial [Flavobacteriales bacterium]|nr:hypothetical protein [Flavobacteriales bacterium]